MAPVALARARFRPCPSTLLVAGRHTPCLSAWAQDGGGPVVSPIDPLGAVELRSRGELSSLKKWHSDTDLIVDQTRRFRPAACCAFHRLSTHRPFDLPVWPSASPANSFVKKILPVSLTRRGSCAQIAANFKKTSNFEGEGVGVFQPCLSTSGIGCGLSTSSNQLPTTLLITASVPRYSPPAPSRYSRQTPWRRQRA